MVIMSLPCLVALTLETPGCNLPDPGRRPVLTRREMTDCLVSMPEAPCLWLATSKLYMGVTGEIEVLDCIDFL